ncbi:serine hydrolase [Paracoccus sp. NBH48]|uniref:serine hydrolase domain-containing protein n=1 Tax=Paracoccus sp. NBH48 TaxID=2596918 RepID=UPI00210819AF|nr:serine hydrolase [Paracoccus sp. NBH48]
MPPLRAIALWQDDGAQGVELAAQGYHGFTPDSPTNIKSASKSVMSALAGIAIGRGLLESADQPIAPLLRSDLPASADPRLARVTLGNLLSMQAGLERQSGQNYGRWVSSPNWVRSALAAPFVQDPGTRMQYSTASTHLVAAILTRVTGRPLLDVARDWLSPIPGFRITGWDRDPQGIYLGGNQMAMSTRSLLAFGATYARGRSGGRAAGRPRGLDRRKLAAPHLQHLQRPGIRLWLVPGADGPGGTCAMAGAMAGRWSMCSPRRGASRPCPSR